MPDVEKITLRWADGTLSGVRHRPARGKTFLVLGHGAGGNMHTPGLVRYAEAMTARGVGVVRFNFPYAEARRKAPDPQSRLVACYRDVADQVQADAAHLYLGGRSMGGRIASHVVAEGFPADGLIFLSYPLHPPGQPERLRTSHLKKIAVPMLFLQGSRDAFARLDLLRAAVEALPEATLHLIEGADHGLGVKDRDPDEVTREMVDATLRWLEGRRNYPTRG